MRPYLFIVLTLVLSFQTHDLNFSNSRLATLHWIFTLIKTYIFGNGIIIFRYIHRLSFLSFFNEINSKFMTCKWYLFCTMFLCLILHTLDIYIRDICELMKLTAANHDMTWHDAGMYSRNNIDVISTNLTMNHCWFNNIELQGRYQPVEAFWQHVVHSENWAGRGLLYISHTAAGWGSCLDWGLLT